MSAIEAFVAIGLLGCVLAALALVDDFRTRAEPTYRTYRP